MKFFSLALVTILGMPILAQSQEKASPQLFLPPALQSLQRGLTPLKIPSTHLPGKSYDHVFAQHDKALIKMIMMLHLRKEANDEAVGKIDQARENLKKLDYLYAHLEYGTSRQKDEAKKEVHAMEEHFNISNYPAAYVREIFPFMMARLKKETAKETTMQQKLFGKLKFFSELIERADIFLDGQKSTLDKENDLLRKRITLFESVFLK